MSDTAERNYQQDAIDAGPVSAAEATEIAQRFIDGHFNNVGKARPIVSIPARPDYDSDIRLMAYIKQSAARTETLERELAEAKKENGRLRTQLAACASDAKAALRIVRFTGEGVYGDYYTDEQE